MGKGEKEMTKETKIKLFQNQEVRLKWDDEIGEYKFSVIDVVGILSESKNPRKYWSVLKTRLNKEGVELATICSQLKLPSHKDGKLYETQMLPLQNNYSVLFKQYLLQMPNHSNNGWLK